MGLTPPDGYVNGYLFRQGGRLYDSHSPVGPLLSLPVYALPVWLGVPADARTMANLLSKLAASVMTAVSAMFVFSTMGRVLEATARPHWWMALVTALAYGLGTPVWSTASQAIWTHTPALLAYAVALWALVAGFWGLAGAAAGAALLARPATAPAAALFAIYVCHIAWRRAREHGRGSSGARTARRDALRYCGAGLLVGALGLSYNLQIFGNALGGEPFRSDYWVRTLGAAHIFSGSLLPGLAGLTVSPNRGLFIFTPLAILAIVGTYEVWRAPVARLSGRAGQEMTLFARYASVAVLVVLLVYAKYLVWLGGAWVRTSLSDGPHALPGRPARVGPRDPPPPHAHRVRQPGLGFRAVAAGLLHRRTGHRGFLLAFTLNPRQ